MRQKMEQPPDKISCLVPCPGCKQEVVSTKWRKGDSVFQSCDCPTCAISWGRVNGGTWHTLGELSANGLKISRMVR